jgi:single-stranded-DNA-specific exonuclease
MNTYSLSTKISGDHKLLHDYSPLLSQLLVNRELASKEQAEAFINPNYDDNYDPFLLFEMEKSLERIYAAIQGDEKITIYADYDADGIPGSVILASLFDKIGYSNYDIYIPHRHDEGYGIHIAALEKIKESGTRLIITIDVGITGFEAADWCKEHDIDLIITDHHLPAQDDEGKEKLPDSYTLVNPKRNECNYPDPMLCGCGVMYKIIQAFVQKYGTEFSIHAGWEKWQLDMVGISTISDLVPLQNENRIFAKFGMQVIKKTKRPGLQKLVWDAGINKNYMTAEDIAFGITPKINAAGRMSHPKDAVAVFLAKDDLGAETSVKHLVKLNNERKKLVAQTMKKAYGKMEKRSIGKVIVIGSPDWQAGILGLVASKLVEKYHVPAFVWSEEHGEIRGSCRTWNGAHLVNIMNAAEPKSFVQFGGHAEAAGFSCDKNEIHFLQERLGTAFDKVQEKIGEVAQEVISIDAEISLDHVSTQNVNDLKKLAPFGMKNEKPLFIFKDVIPEYVGQFGKTKEHLEIKFKNSFGKEVRAITFFKTPEDYSCVPTEGKKMNLIGHIEHSVFMGRHEVRVKIVDVVSGI